MSMIPQMDPLLLQQLIARQQMAPPPAAVPPAPPIPGTVPNEAAGGVQGTLASLLGTIQSPEPHRTPLPATTFPEAPRSMDPAFTQMVMQALMSASNAGGEIDSLGALLGGK